MAFTPQMSNGRRFDPCTHAIKRRIPFQITWSFSGAAGIAQGQFELLSPLTVPAGADRVSCPVSQRSPS